MRQSSRFYFLTALVACLPVCGCSQPATAPPPKVAQQAPPAELHGLRPEKPAQVAAKADEKSAAEQPAAHVQAKFDPPYKDRVDMFQPPSRKHAVKSSNSTSEVLLRGFVNVDRPKALLVVDGRLQALAVGERRGELEVIQIDRPLVTLQRGRVRWTESLYPEG